MPSAKFQADPGTIRMVIDYPFDEGNHSPADDVLRVHELQEQLGDGDTLIWLPHFLSEERLADLSSLVVINYVLERDRLTEVTPTWTADDRHHARTQLESRRGALTVRLREALRRAYGINSQDGADLGPQAAEQVMTLARDLNCGCRSGSRSKPLSSGFAMRYSTTVSPDTPILIRTDAGWLSGPPSSTWWSVSLTRRHRIRSAGTKCPALKFRRSRRSPTRSGSG